MTNLRLGALVLALSLVRCTACNTSSAAKPELDAARGPRIVRLDPAAAQRVGVKVDAAGSSTASHSLRVYGTLDYNYDKYAEVGVPLDGRVSGVNVKVSDRVKNGQVLATIIVPSVAQAQADYLQAQASTSAARKNRDREDDLLTRSLTTAREAEQARSEALKAEADLAAAEARLRALRVAIPQSNTVVANAGTLSLTSPIEGVVVSRKANLGVYLTPNETAFIIADLQELWASLEIHETELEYLQVGADVDITIDALQSRKVPGKLALIEPQLGKATRAARARVTVPNADGALRPGLFIRAQVQLPADAPGRLLVVAGAVQPLADQDVVFVEREAGVYEVRPVSVGRRTPALVEVTQGLSKGERIVIEGAFLLRSEVVNQ